MDQVNRIHQQKVVVIRLPANYQGSLPTGGTAASLNTSNNQSGDGGPQLADINQIPDEIIAEMVSNQYKHQQEHPIDHPKGAATDPNMMIDNSDDKQVDMFGLDHPDLAASNSTTTTTITTSNPAQGSGQATYSRANRHNNNETTKTNNGHTTTTKNTSTMGSLVTSVGIQQLQPPPPPPQQQQQHQQQVVVQQSLVPASSSSETPAQPDSSRAAAGEEEEKVLYRNYSPKQREWMLVVLSYSRGLMVKPFEMKLQETVVEKARDVLRANAETFGLTNRIPTHKTLRGIWANLWKHPDRTVGVVKKGGRPRIDPAIKRQNRNEREKRRRAAKRQSKESANSSGDYGENGDGNYYHEMDHQSGANVSGMARRSQRNS